MNDEQKSSENQKPRIKTQRKKALALAAIGLFLCVVLLRLSIISKGAAVPDADECVVGLMAIHIAEGRGHPLYFYGQNYGAGAGVEAHLAAMAFKAFGPSGAALKLDGLLFWIALALLGWRLARALWGDAAGYFSLMFLSAAPEMAEWSMKARGGHLIALALLMAALLFVARMFKAVENRKAARQFEWAAAAGICLVLAGWIQAIASPAAGAVWLISLIMVIISRRGYAALGLIIGTGIMALVFIVSPADPTIWSPLFALEGKGMAVSLKALVSYALPRFFTPYLDPIAFPLTSMEIFTAVVWGAGLVAAIIGATLKLHSFGLVSPSSRTTFIMLTALVAAIVSAALVDESSLHPRHLLVLYPLSCLLMGRFFSDILSKPRTKIIAAGLMLILISGLYVNARELSRTRFHNPGIGYLIDNSTPRLTVAALKARGVKRVFCADNDFQWNLNFAGQGELLARSFPPLDRYQPIVDEVNRAARASEPIAVVIPNPEGPLKKPLVQDFRAGPHSKTERVNQELIIFYGAPVTTIFKFFPER